MAGVTLPPADEFAAILAAEAARVAALPVTGSEKRRVRADITATRWLCFAPDPTLTTLDKIKIELGFYSRGEITGDAALAGIAAALCLNERLSEKVEG